MVKQIGRFILQKCIGEGGVAKVYLASDPDDQTNGPIVVKVGAATDELDFLKEANILSRLEHPNIVRIIDYGKDNSSVFIAMEYVRGVDLHTLLANNGALSAPLAAMIAGAIASALAAAHALKDSNDNSLNIVHRDVTPTNILLSEDGRVLLADFGIARWNLTEVRTGSGIIKGKYEYLSPEQAMGVRAGQAADQFALGLVLFEMLCGKRAYDAADPFDLIELAANCSLLDPKDALPQTAHSLLPIVERLLQKNVDHRYASMAEARDAIGSAERPTLAPKEALARLVKRVHKQLPGT